MFNFINNPWNFENLIYLINFAFNFLNYQIIYFIWQKSFFKNLTLKLLNFCIAQSYENINISAKYILKSKQFCNALMVFHTSCKAKPLFLNSWFEHSIVQTQLNKYSASVPKWKTCFFFPHRTPVPTRKNKIITYKPNSTLVNDTYHLNVHERILQVVRNIFYRFMLLKNT